ncbi:MAG: RHS repeat-associated core domain-containing protein [Candidatus Brocadiia bacterium]
MEERDGSGNLVARFTYAAGYIDAPARQERDLNADDDFGDDDEVVWYHSNTLYSVYALTDASENVVERYRYDAYGACTVLDPDFSADADNASDVDNPYLFTGRRLDAESGLMQYRHRYYAPELGRFISRDPHEYADGQSLYPYCGAGPMNAIDPLGRQKLAEERQPFKGKIEWDVRWIEVHNYPRFIRTQRDARDYLGVPDHVSLPPVTEKKRVSNWVEYTGKIRAWCTPGPYAHHGEIVEFESNAKGWDDMRLGIPTGKGFTFGYRYKRWVKCLVTDGYGYDTIRNGRRANIHNVTITCRAYKRHSLFGTIAPPVKGEWPKKGKVMGEKVHHLKKVCCE